jgi:hypothetical protein
VEQGAQKRLTGMPKSPAFFRLLFFGPLVFGGLHDFFATLLRHL